MLRRHYAILTILVVCLIAAATFLFRNDAVEGLLKSSLSDYGISTEKLGVVKVSHRTIVIENTRLKEIQIEFPRVEAFYTIAGLVSGKIDKVVVSGSKADVQAFNRLDFSQVLSSWEEPRGSLKIGTLQFENGQIDFGPRVSIQAEVNGQIDFDTGEARAEIEVVSRISNAHLVLNTDSLAAGSRVFVTGQGLVSFEDLAPLTVPYAGGATGQAVFDFGGSFSLRDIMESIERKSAPNLSLRGDFQIAGLEWPSGPTNVTTDLSWQLDKKGEALELKLDEPAPFAGLRENSAPGFFEIGNYAVPFSGEISNVAPLLRWQSTEEGGRVELNGMLALANESAEGKADIKIRFDHDQDWKLREAPEIWMTAEGHAIPARAGDFRGVITRLNTQLEGHLSLTGAINAAGPVQLQLDDIIGSRFSASTLDLQAEIDLGGTRENWAASLSSPGLLRLQEGLIPNLVRLDEPLEFTFEEASFSQTGTAYSAKAAGGFQGDDGALLAADAQPRVFKDVGGHFTLNLETRDKVSGAFSLSEGRIEWPAEAVRISELEFLVPFQAEAIDAPISISGGLSDMQTPPRYASIAIDAEATKSADQMLLHGFVSAMERGVRLPLDGVINLAELSADLKIGPGQVNFEEDGIQPGNLLKVFSSLEDVKGGVEVNLDVKLRPGEALRTFASLEFLDLSAAQGDLAVSKLSGTLNLAELFPIRSDGAQSLLAGSVIAGVPVAGATANFTIRSREGLPIFDLHSGSGTIAGGTVSLRDEAWDVSSDKNSFRVRVRNLNIETLLREWRVEGISGAGRLSGTIPVSISERGLSIRGGRLEAAGPGVLRVDWGSARERLMRSGEQVALAVTALESFSYQALAIDISKPVGGELAFAISLDGANPSVLDGYPFRFNITLRGRLEPILDAVREGRRIGGSLFWGGFGSQ
ncbi:intermembrane phospholipid transport protein YdbH family protein [Lutimaribacter saemankumensis]|uniref:Dicarboxylate transport n=1 Tax=Lutimaribacter saemankumensis TaxID=490829 RepID=A0A1G8T344_9RHOB|nr:YdbH domain-containing protein [Lutimaribacter saemankumensis]SDJ35978.1 Dicarboxylate transport [Lutimaribacter saemankumensis]